METTNPVMSITDEQIAEIEEIAGYGDRVQTIFTEDILALISRLRAAERDAARYQHLRDSCNADTWERLGYEAGAEFDRVVDRAMKGDQQ